MNKNKKRVGGKERIREADPSRDDFASKMIGHFVPYEIGMMRALHQRLATGSSSQFCRNALIESFHIHARNLMEFFKDDKQCAIDPRSFTGPNFKIEGDFIHKKLESKISQQIVHLTHERTDLENDKLSDDERQQTLNLIEKQIARFEKALKPEWSPVWQKGLKDMNFGQVTGENQTLRYVTSPTGPTGPTNPSHLDIPSNIVRGATNQIQTASSESAIKGRKF